MTKNEITPDILTFQYLVYSTAICQFKFSRLMEYQPEMNIFKTGISVFLKGHR